MKIVITGVAGFIGSHLSEALLAKGHTVIGIDNFDDFYSKNIKDSNLKNSRKSPSFHFIQGDIAEKKTFQLIPEKADVVVHLAARAGVRPSIERPEDYIQTNITGTFNVLEWMRETGCAKLVFASSSSVYGNNKKIPFSETDSVDWPISPYAFTKKSCELMNFNYHHLYSFDILNLRFFTVYGPRQRPDLAIHKFVKMVDRGEAVTMYGDGNTSRDYTFVFDIINGIIRSIDYVTSHKNVFEIINIGNNNPISISDLINKIHEIMGKELNVVRLPLPKGDVDITYADISKAERILGYQPATPLEKGLRDFVEWYRMNNLIHQ